MTTPDLMSATSVVNALGRVESDVSALGLTTSYKYDNWGNLKKSTDFLGKITIIKKFLNPADPAGTYNVSKKREGGTETIVKMDKFDREVETKGQTINGQWVIVNTEYDVFGKKIRISEPHFANETPKWNTTTYDNINRPITQTSFSGKTINTCYEGLKVTVEENNGTKKTSRWSDAMGNTVRHADGGGDIFYSHYPNGALKETNYDGIKTKIEIDGWGNKTKLDDPSAGVYLYSYDNLSRPLTETNPKGGVTTYHYDNLGRPDIETTVGGTGENTNISKSFAYNGTTKLPTVISGTYNGKSYTYTTYYNDPYYRVTGKKEQTPYFTYESTNSYDAFGRPETTELKTTYNSYVSTSNVKNIYDGNGILIKQRDSGANKDIWQINTINSHGQTTQLQYGNGYEVNNTYDANNFNLKAIKHNNNTTTVVDVLYNYDPTKGVLLSRNNVDFGRNETFLYDNLDRLLEERTNGTLTQGYSYDKRGRMTSNTAVGKYNYNEQNYKLQDINFNANGQTLNTSRGFTEIQYNTFKNPNEVFLSGKDRISYEFSILKTRAAAYYGSLSTTAASRPNRKFYSADKAVEIVKEGNITKIITYITGDPYSANYIKIDVLNNNSLVSADNYYLHRDNQSSIVAITKADAAGTVVEKRFFDAWGNLKAATVSNVATTISALGWANNLLIDRGYTGHEYLKTVGLMHMNGRIYDSVMRRFLSPDNYVQDPYNTQNYNRFGYVYNNPLLYSDPSGEFIIEALIIALIINGINNSMNNVPFFYGAGKAMAMAAATAIISFGVGAAMSGSFSSAFTASTMTLKEAALSGLGNILGSFMPKWDIKMGDWSISINAAILLGNSNGLGLNIQVSYTSGNLSLSYGFGMNGFAKFQNTGKSGVQFRNSFIATYDDGKTGFSLGTNLWSGAGGMKNSFDQRTGVIGFHSGDFKLMYENDGGFGMGKNIFKYIKLPYGLGGGSDSYRTAALNLSVGEYSAGFNLFTGERSEQNQLGEKKGFGFKDAMGVYHQNPPTNEQDTKYRLGAAYFGYQGLRVGVNSEHVRHAIQNSATHRSIQDNEFVNTSWDWKGYSQYQTPNKFTTW